MFGLHAALNQENKASTVVPAEKKPVFGMKSKKLNRKVLDNNETDFPYHARLASQIITSYQHALLQATLRAVGGEVVVIPDTASPEDVQFDFVRDPVVVLPDQNLMLYTSENIHHGAMDILDEGKKLGYVAEKIEDAYFEGGNIFYSCTKKVLLHGMDPTGYYITPKGNYKIEPEKTNEALSRKLSLRDISVIGLALHPDIKHSPDLRNKYYHLDCFMQLLPDGRVIILNKDILSQVSQEKMQKIFGNDFIDLGYSAYRTEPILFNFISIQKNDGIYLLASHLPLCIIESLQHLKLKVITSQMLDSTRSTYHKDIAEKVALILQKEGYETVNAENLARCIPKNIRGYAVDDGMILPPDEKDKAYFVENISLDVSFIQTYRSYGFDFGDGGPHCLTTDLTPDHTLLKQLGLTTGFEYKNELTPDSTKHVHSHEASSVDPYAKQANKLGIFARSKKLKTDVQPQSSYCCVLM